MDNIFAESQGIHPYVMPDPLRYVILSEAKNLYNRVS